MAKNVEWVKITTDMFDNRKIKHLRKLPDGNSIVLIWVMLLTMAGRCNAGGMIFLTENIPYTPKMLADELGFELSTIQLALEALERLNMISRNEDMLFISGWEEHQNIEALEKIRENNRDRKRKQRAQEKLLLEAQCNMSRDCHVTVTDDVTQCHAAEEEREEDKEKDPKKDFDKSFIGVGVTSAHVRFAPPTVDDILNYCRETGVTIDAQRFVDFYASKGWKVGMTPMTDWRASVRSWAARDRAEAKKQNPRFDYQQREYTEEDFGESFYFDPRRDLERYYGDGGADDASG